MTVDELQVIITANAEQLRKELAASKAEITNLSKQTSAMSSNMTGHFGRIGTGAVALGNLVASGVTAALRAITSTMGDAVSRLDTLNNYPRVMSNLGISTEDSKKSIQRLNDQLVGLPTTIDAAAMSVQRFTSANGNIGASTEMFLALNNAILAGGANTQIQQSALEQLSQSYAKGKPDMMEWRTAMMAMPAQLKQVATAMGYVNADQLGAALRDGDLNMNDFMKTIVRMNQEGVAGFKSFDEQARNATGGVGTSMINVKTALTRGLADIMNAIGQANIAGFFSAIASAINFVVPYVVAFVKVLAMAASWVSSLFGGGAKKTQAMADGANAAAASVGNVGVAASGASDGLGSAAGQASKLKKELNGLASFDAMNVLKPAADSSGSGGAGGTSGSGADLSGMTSGIGEVSTGLDKVSGKVQAILGFFNEIGRIGQAIWNTAPVQAFVGAIGAYIGFVISYWTQLGQAVWTNLVTTWQTIAPNMALTMNNLSVLWTLFWTQMQATITTYGQPMIDGTIGLFNSIWADAIDPFIVLVSQIWADFSQSLLTTWQTYGQSIFDGIGQFVVNTIALFQSIWDNVLAPIIQPFLQAMSDLWNQHLKAMVDEIIKFVAQVIDAALKIYNNFIAPVAKFLLEILKPAFVTIGSVIGGVLGTVFGTIADVVGGILKALGGLITFLTGVFTGNWKQAWQGIQDVFSGLVNGLVAIFKAPLNLIIDLINGMIAGINSIKIPDWVPGIGGKNLNIPKIPKLARGGIIDSATVAVVGEAGKEAVMPLENNTGWIDQLAGMIAARGGAGDQPMQVIVKVGEDTLIRKVINGINDRTYQNNGGVITV